MEDTHICGLCKQSFSNVEVFIEHKSKCGEQAREEHDMTSHDDEEEVCELRTRLLSLAAAAQAELDSDQQMEQLREQDAADVLVNQLGGPHVFEISVNSESHEEESKQEKKTTKKSPGKKKANKKEVLKTVFKCQELGCNYEARYYKDLIRHTRIHTGEKPFECGICNRSFSRSDKLKNHMRIHSGFKPFQCDQCEYACADSTGLRKHIRTHTNERPCKCQLCPYRARDMSQLIVHLRTHTGDVPFVCLAPGCKAAFKTSSDLKRHTRLHTNEKPFCCDTCDYRTRMKGNLLAHMRRAHLGGKKKYPCNVCNAFVALTYSALIEHKKTHASTLLRCNVGDCTYVGMTFSAIRCHLRSKHPEHCPQLTCKHCSFACSSFADLRGHMQEEHPTLVKKKEKKPRSKDNRGFTKAHQCPMCDESYVREDSLRAHIRVHERANTGQKGVVVLDTSQPPFEARETQIERPAVFEVNQQQGEQQQVLFYVPNAVESQETLMLGAMQQGMHYILVPSVETPNMQPLATAQFVPVMRSAGFNPVEK